ncbi:LysR family transcriptional regulator [Streptomyces sp. N2-109]|uniref:LysR family transcriptional regulator n=1 Tax=Streptomyces gossypii TaxID=2883101 RepID=A0ABT2JPI0_9ACTN|nr:LysR family transcriptional regulator [Streptomyces gossypii]MCT2589726.1 LysR family transcriptional regulator [Streptomyces gossypii]
MSGVEVRELECFLVLAEELHFGRTGERLYVSQSRVSQLLRALEHRIGTRLVDRTSRRVRLTPFGEGFLASLRPAYDNLRLTVEDARSAARGVRGRLRVGFQGTVHGAVMTAITAFQTHCPECDTDIVEIPLSDPFGPLRRQEVDLAVVLLPLAEKGLTLGPVFSKQPQHLAVSADHPLAARESLTAEDLAEVPLIPVAGPAPGYWRRAHAPSRTPGGAPVRHETAVRTLQEGLTLIAAGRGAMLLCGPTAEYAGARGIRFVPVAGLPDSALGLIWPQGKETAHTRAFSAALSATLR